MRGNMNYIELLKQGKTLICNYKKIQTDNYGDSWSNEIWYKNDDKYICKYVNLDFTTEHNLDEMNVIWTGIKNMINYNEVTVNIVDDINPSTSYDRIIPIGEITHIIHELDLTREFIIKQNLVKELNDYVKNNHKNS